MSARRLPREMGTWIYCNGTDDDGCPTKEKRFTANVVFKYNREFAAKDGWGRGLRTNQKRRDLCPSCLAKEKELFAEQEAKAKARKAAREEKLKAIATGTPLPKKPRKKAGVSISTTSSHLAAFAQAPPT